MGNKGLQVKEGRTELYVPHNGKTLTFIHPCAGPNTYVKVGEQIESQNLRKPTFAEITSLVHSAHQNLDNKYSEEIVHILKKGYFWGFNGILYVQNEGAYIQDLPEIKNGRVSMDKSQLVKRLEANDSSVRFVPFGFRTEEQSLIDIAKNKFVIALAGEGGADKLAEIAEKFSKKLYVWSFNEVQGEITNVPALGDYIGDWLGLGGLDCDGCVGGYAFGVSESGEAKR
ncbi:MAG: hypothetical protein Q8L29_01530 [archaeon]|nr:hypothetical protein [archaeon]